MLRGRVCGGATVGFCRGGGAGQVLHGAPEAGAASGKVSCRVLCDASLLRVLVLVDASVCVLLGLLSSLWCCCRGFFIFCLLASCVVVPPLCWLVPPLCWLLGHRRAALSDLLPLLATPPQSSCLHRHQDPAVKPPVFEIFLHSPLTPPLTLANPPPNATSCIIRFIPACVNCQTSVLGTAGEEPVGRHRDGVRLQQR